MRYCCEKCFDIKEIKDFIIEQNDNGDCEFCGSKSVPIAETAKVGDFLQDGINRGYEPAEDSLPYDSEIGDYALGTTYDAYDILNENEIFSELIDDPGQLVDSLVDTHIKYSTYDPLGPDIGGDHEFELWNRFCKEIKYKRRFITFEEFFEKLSESKSIFKELVANLNKCIKVISKGSTIYRGRINNKAEKYSEKELTSAPAEKVKNNRMSPAGISFFYGSFDIETCIAEISPSIGDTVSIGSFNLLKDIKVFDLSIDPNIHNIFNPLYDYYEDNFVKPFIRKFSKEISKPIDRDSSGLEYIPTQIFTEYIRYFPSHDFHGIIYSSSQYDGGKNVVLFHGPEISSKDSSSSALLEFIKYLNYKTKMKSYSYAPVTAVVKKNKKALFS